MSITTTQICIRCDDCGREWACCEPAKVQWEVDEAASYGWKFLLVAEPPIVLCLQCSEERQKEHR